MPLKFLTFLGIIRRDNLKKSFIRLTKRNTSREITSLLAQKLWRYDYFSNYREGEHFEETACISKALSLCFGDLRLCLCRKGRMGDQASVTHSSKPLCIPPPSMLTGPASALLMDSGVGNLELGSYHGNKKLALQSWIQEMERGQGRESMGPGLP